MRTRGAPAWVRKTATGFPLWTSSVSSSSSSSRAATIAFRASWLRGGPSRPAVDDEPPRILGHLGIEVVAEHPERRLLVPALALPLGASGRAHRAEISHQRLDARRDGGGGHDRNRIRRGVACAPVPRRVGILMAAAGRGCGAPAPSADAARLQPGDVRPRRAHVRHRAPRQPLRRARAGGVIRVRHGGRLLRAPVPRHLPARDDGRREQGLLSMAFAPHFDRNHRVYVDFTNLNGDTRVVQYRTFAAQPKPGEPGHEARPAQGRTSRSTTTTAASSRSAPTAALHLARRRRVGRRPQPERPEQGPALDHPPDGPAKPHPTRGHVRVRPAKPLAVLVRQEDRRDVDRRRRPGHAGRRSTTSATTRPRARTSGGASTRAAACSRTSRSTARSCGSRSRSTATASPAPTTARSPAATSTAGARSRASRGQYLYADFCSGRIWKIPSRGGRPDAHEHELQGEQHLVVRRGLERRALRRLARRHDLQDRPLSQRSAPAAASTSASSEPSRTAPARASISAASDRSCSSRGERSRTARCSTATAGPG